MPRGNASDAARVRDPWAWRGLARAAAKGARGPTGRRRDGAGASGPARCSACCCGAVCRGGASLCRPVCPGGCIACTGCPLP